MSSCRICVENGKCGYSVSYTEGSSIKGGLVSDDFWFGSAEGGKKAVRASFGCQTYELGLFYSQVADGITGFSQGQAYGPVLFDYLRTATGCPNVFSICLSEETGAMVLGGGVPAELQAEWIPYSGSGSYTVEMTDVRIKGVSVGERELSFRNCIIDSGTTFMYLPPTAYKKVSGHWREQCPWGACSERAAAGECVCECVCVCVCERERERGG